MQITIALRKTGWVARFEDVPDMPDEWLPCPFTPLAPFEMVRNAVANANPGINVVQQVRS